MIHVCNLDTLAIKDGVLVFANEQQACWSWGIPLVRLSEDDPALVANPGGEWQDDGCSLEEFLRFVALTNRPYEPPFIDQSSYDQKCLKGPLWERHDVKWKTIQHQLWTNGHAVVEEESGNLGARNLDALRKAAASLNIDRDEVDEAINDHSDSF